MAFALSQNPMPTTDNAAAIRASVRQMARLALVVLGGLVIAVGVVLALLPGHLGVPILVIGLMIVLRNSLPARKEFIKLQRKHPNFVFPLRRLMRREPEVVPVVWQQILRTERMVLPRKWRVSRKLRVRYLSKQRPPHSAR
jgi:hypothetical protein